MKHENITCCDAIGHSNGGVHIQNLIASHPQMVDKIIFSHSLTSMSAQDAYTVNNTEVELYRKAKILMKIFPTSILLNALGGQFNSPQSEQYSGLRQKCAKFRTYRGLHGLNMAQLFI